MRTRTLLFCSLVAASLCASSAFAQSAWMYDIGGAEPISKPIWNAYNAVPLSVSVDADWSFSCGKFSMKNSVNKMLSDLRNAGDDYLNAMVANAQAAVSSLPAILLQRASPSLYDVMQNGLLRAQAGANAARLDCKAMEESIIASGGGVGAVWNNFKQAAKLTDWKAEATYSSGDVVKASANVEQNAGKNGIAWVASNGTSRAGGVGMPPINMIGDVMRAGFKQVVRLGNAPSNAASIASDPSGASGKSGAGAKGLLELYNLWFPGEQNAVNYINRVAGEVTTTTQADSVTKTRAGQGLRAEVIAEADRIRPKVIAAINRARPMTLAERREISKGGTELSPLLIKAIRDLPLDDRTLITERLVNEIAMQNEILRALVAISIYQQGDQLPDVQGNGTAKEKNIEVIAMIRGYIEDLMYEEKIKKELVAMTAVSILGRAAAVRGAEVVQPVRTDEREIELGATKRQR